MLSDRGAREFDAITFALDLDQGEVAGAAADVADQHDLPVEQALLRLREMVRDPGIERSGRLFEERQILDAGFLRRLDRKLARFFVERRRYGQHDMLRAERLRLSALSQASAEVLEVPRGNLDRRQNTPGLLRIPRQDFRGAVHVRVREPRLSPSARSW